MGNNVALLKNIAEAANRVPPPTFGMVGAAMVNLMGGTLNKAILNEVVKEADAEYLISEESIKSRRGLVVSEDDLMHIFSYVENALMLPNDIESAEKYLGYKSDDVFFKDEKHKKFSPEEQVKFDLPIINHAKGWNEIESSIKNVGNDLNVYADVFVKRADTMLKILGDLGLYIKSYGLLDEEGNEIVEAGVETLELWEKNTKEKQESTQVLYDKLVQFNEVLENDIRVSVVTRKEAISELEINEEIKKLKGDIKNLESEIDQLESEYSECVGLAFTGAAGMILPGIGIISWAVTGGIFGAKAEKIRKKKNQLIDQKEELEKRYNADNNIKQRISELSKMTGQLSTAINSAITGVKNLCVTWDSILKDIELARECITVISDKEQAIRIINLIDEIKLAKNSWENCGNMAKELVDEFNEAHARYEKTKEKVKCK